MSRFILNLRLLDSQPPALDMSTPSGLVPAAISLHWPSQSGSARISAALALANIGAPLDLDRERVEDGDGDGDEPFCDEDEKQC